MGRKLLFLTALAVSAMSGTQAEAQNLSSRSAAKAPAKTTMGFHAKRKARWGN